MSVEVNQSINLSVDSPVIQVILVSHYVRRLICWLVCRSVNSSLINFPASRGLVSFAFAFAWLTSTGKSVLCHRSKLTVLSIRGGYLAIESSRDASCCVGSLNNSGITVKECAGHTAGSSHSQQTYHGACGLKSAV